MPKKEKTVKFKKMEETSMEENNTNTKETKDNNGISLTDTLALEEAEVTPRMVMERATGARRLPTI